MKTTCLLSYQDHCGEIITNKPCKYPFLLCTTVQFFLRVKGSILVCGRVESFLQSESGKVFMYVVG
jgi:hypothetical protein